MNGGVSATTYAKLQISAQNLVVDRCVQVRMSDQPPPRDTTTKARQGETTGVVRWVLGISLTLVIVGMVIAFLVF
jgi:hypothetical protein